MKTLATATVTALVLLWIGVALGTPAQDTRSDPPATSTYEYLPQTIVTRLQGVVHHLEDIRTITTSGQTTTVEVPMTGLTEAISGQLGGRASDAPGTSAEPDAEPDPVVLIQIPASGPIAIVGPQGQFIQLK